ncbi:MAG: HAMP domain-containing sensor histidine kinase [Polyangiaceae bacterium]
MPRPVADSSPSFALPRKWRGLPLVPTAPALVLAVGIATAVAIAVLGITPLARISDGASLLRAEVTAVALAARIRSTALEDRSELLGRAARRSGSEVLLVGQDGRVLINESFGAPSAEDVTALLVAGRGTTYTKLGRVSYVARPLAPPLEHLSIIAFTSAPSPPPGSMAIVKAVATLTALLLGVAVTVALAFTRAARDDVDYVRHRIKRMARADADPAGEPIPIRSLDQVGALTAAFNQLVARFAAAEKTYRADLLQASAIDTERSAFLAGLSHELRTPLNAILGFAHVLESEVDGPLNAEGRESLGVIRTSGEHLRALIDDILDLSAMETGSLVLSRRALDVRAAAEQVVREAAPSARGKPVALSVTGNHGVLAYADRRRFRQVLTNLVSNAVKFTRQGWVNVHVGTHDGFALVAVRDTGTGIAREDQRAIFEEYQQSGDVRSRRAGTGLGLAIARRLVMAHGGGIELESALGQGSTFVVKLPLYDMSKEHPGDPAGISGGYDPMRGSEPSIRLSEPFGMRPSEPSIRITVPAPVPTPQRPPATPPPPPRKPSSTPPPRKPSTTPPPRKPPSAPPPPMPPISSGPQSAPVPPSTTFGVGWRRRGPQ